MGEKQNDVRLVVHWNLPQSLYNYYQVGEREEKVSARRADERDATDCRPIRWCITVERTCRRCGEWRDVETRWRL